MDQTAVSTLVSNLGFPIVAVIACAIYIWKMTEAQREDNRERIKEFEQREDDFNTQLKNFNDVLNKIDSVLIKIDMRLEALEEEKK